MEKKPADTLSPFDITKMLAVDPVHPKYGPSHASHYWSEPAFGYYLSDDEWVIRKHAQMLSDAGVDLIILDITNTFLYLPQLKKLMSTWETLRKEGRSTPAFACIVNSEPKTTVNRLRTAAGQALLEKYAGGGIWKPAGSALMAVKGREMEFSITKKGLGITGNHFTIDCKWTDNIPCDSDPMRWLDTVIRRRMEGSGIALSGKIRKIGVNFRHEWSGEKTIYTISGGRADRRRLRQRQKGYGSSPHPGQDRQGCCQRGEGPDPAAAE